ncbi:MAG: gliding motility-associated C-terminal domain-containing protein [Flavobacteriales bacterium]|nr:gliding motility-associated C-terminal domain-containing protein [Flavobacteriales bacterium]
MENQNEGCDISVPNVFSPNGDGRNDVFIIQGLAGRMNSFRIFNSWGTQVYSRVNYLNDWSPDNLSEGTYYYVLSVEELEDLTGFVTLVR